jgi:hypothetical protein
MSYLLFFKVYKWNYVEVIVGVLDESSYTAKPAQLSSHTGPPGYIGWTRCQPMQTGGSVRLLLADYKVEVPLKTPATILEWFTQCKLCS